MKFIEIGHDVFLRADHVTMVGAPAKHAPHGFGVMLMLLGQDKPHFIHAKDAEDAAKNHARLLRLLGIADQV